MMNICGIDVSKDTLEVVIRKNGKSLKSSTFENSASGHKALCHALRQNKVARVGMEATGYYHLGIALALHHVPTLELMIINPRAAHNFAKAMMQQTKTDCIDAEILAQFTGRMDFVPWIPPVSEVFDLRACGRRLVSLSKDKTRAKNQLHAFLAAGNMPNFIIEDMKLTISQLESQINNIVVHSLRIIHESKTLGNRYERLISISGIADRTAIKLLGEIGVLSADMSAKQWVAHAGLFPRIFQSGTSVNKKTRIGKSGNHYVREALYMGAMSASRHEPHIRAFYQHLVNDNGLTKLQALCAVMRKMLLAIHGMLKEDKAFDGKRFFTLLPT
jgi:transposase